MKKIIPRPGRVSLGLIIILLLLFGGMVFAQEVELPAVSQAELPDPGLCPDSPFYFLERIAEGVGTFFTFGDLKKAERYATLAAERLAEAKAVVEKGKPELAEKTLQRYENQLNNSMARAEKAMFEGKDFEKVMGAIAKAGKTTSVHLGVLTEIYEKVPEQTKTAVENAIKVSVKRHEKAVEALKASDHLGEVPEEAPISTNIPQAVRERIQTRVQQELGIEKALKGVDLSKSLRDICAEQGGTPEMCEEFPLQKFKSFEQIEAFCTEKGGPPEICTSLEAKCREFGVTTANECFILLSVSSIKTYTTTELKISPAPSLSEEEMKEGGGRQLEIRIQSPAERTSGNTKDEPVQRRTPTISKVIIYTMPICPHCLEAKEWLGKNGISFEEIDVSQDKGKQNELKERIGQVVVPVIEAGGETVVGFNKDRLSELFGM